MNILTMYEFCKRKLDEIYLVVYTIKNEINIKKGDYIEKGDIYTLVGVDIKGLDLCQVFRQHWSIENKIHWHLDFTFFQDKNSTTNKNALLNLEIIHKFVLAILEKAKSKYNKASLKRIRKHLSNNFEEFFLELLCYAMLKY